jgi:hypothetical protein
MHRSDKLRRVFSEFNRKKGTTKVADNQHEIMIMSDER